MQQNSSVGLPVASLQAGGSESLARRVELADVNKGEASSALVAGTTGRPARGLRSPGRVWGIRWAPDHHLLGRHSTLGLAAAQGVVLLKPPRSPRSGGGGHPAVALAHAPGWNATAP